MDDRTQPRADRRRLSHVDRGGRPRMVDVSEKAPTARRAVAEALVTCSQDTLTLVIDGGGPKGDVLTVAELAGVMAAKRTSELIPLCHPLPLTDVVVRITPGPGRVGAADPHRGCDHGPDRCRDGGPHGGRRGRPDPVRHGQGGREGGRDPERPAGLEERREVRRVASRRRRCPPWPLGAPGREPSGAPRAAAGFVARRTSPAADVVADLRTAFVLTVSDRGAAGSREDASGAAVAARLAALGFAVERGIVPDERERIREALVAAASRNPLVVTTGGTGLTPRDVTPQATLAVIDYEIPGFAEAMRADGRAITPMAILSRAVVGVRDRCLIVNLPGSPKGAVESLASIEPVLEHALETLAGPYDHAGWPRTTG